MPIKKKIEKSNKNLTTTSSTTSSTTITRRDIFIKNTGLRKTFGTNVVKIIAKSSFFSIQEIEEGVKRAIQNAKDYSLTFENQDKSFQDLGFDSLDIIEIKQSVESEFKIDIPNEISEGLNTFNQIVEYIRIREPSPFFFKEKEFRMQRDYTPTTIDLSSYATDTKYLTINDPDIIEGKRETGYYPFNYKIENIPGVSPIILMQDFNGFIVNIPTNDPVGCKLTMSRSGKNQTTSANFIWY